MVNTERWNRAQALFKAALERAPDERAALLAQPGEADPELRQEVESLLAHFQAARTFLEHRPFGSSGVEPTEAPRVGQSGASGLRGQRIGSYEILDLLAEGGMGVVYLARQDHPPRCVALKLLRPGLATAGMLRRFEHEAEVLGRLQHPGIAQILEAGTAETGDGPQPFFAMEFIEGQPLTEYAAARCLSIQQRLELLEKVCEAVHHAHQKGVIHRDLKPANILVDAAGQPKILDFGVARVTDAGLQTVTRHTDPGQLLGTIPYMSPEQVAGDPREVDTRSDVYALAVVGYELLIGRLPCDLERRSPTEAIRAITDELPARLGSINRRFRGDLETVFAKALEKEKSRRYPSVSAFSADLRSYLRHEPIAARAPSVLYVLGRFARRNRGLAVGAGLAVSALLVGSIAATSYAVAAKRAAAEAQNQRAAAEDARDKSEAVVGFLVNMLTAVNPVRLGREVRVRDVLDQASQTIEGQFEAQPLIEGYLQHVLGLTYLSLGDYSPAELHLAKALELRCRYLGDAHEDVAMSLNNLAQVLYQEGDYAQAEALYRQALAIARTVYGNGHHRVARTLHNLGVTLRERGSHAEAEACLRESLVICRASGQDDVTVARALSQLGGLLVLDGNQAEAEPLLREALAIQRELLSDGHPDVAATLNSLALLLKAEGDYAGAEHLLREALMMQRRVLGDEHSDVAATLANLGMLHQARGEYASAEPPLRQALDIRRRRLGASHPALAKSLYALGRLLKANGNDAEADTLLSEASAIDQLRASGSDTTFPPIP